MKNLEEAIDKAIKMREKSYAVYSNFKVGAALVCKNGNIYSGCNIENAAFSPTICAERTAFAKAISEGENAFDYIVIAGGQKKLGFINPCGVCLQFMLEFCGGEEFKIILAKSLCEYKIFTLNDFLPNAFHMN